MDNKTKIEIIGIIVGLILIWIHVKEIKEATGFGDLCFVSILLAFIVVFLVIFKKEKKIEEVIGTFFKCVIFFLTVKSFMNLLIGQTPIEPFNQHIINTIGFWHLAFLICIGAILTWEQKLHRKSN